MRATRESHDFNRRDFDGRRAQHRYSRLQQKRKAAIRKLTFACMTAIFVIILGLSTFSLSAKADTDIERADEHKYYTSHMITPGESLWSIAEDNMDTRYYACVQDYMEEIKAINDIRDTNLKIGDYVLIPYFSEELK